MASKKKVATAALGSKAARRAARRGGKVALKGATRAVTPKEPATTRLLKYGFFTLLGLVIGSLIARSGRETDVSSSSFSGGTGQHTPDPGSPAGRRGETWGTGTPLGTGGAVAGGTSDPASPAAQQRTQDPNRTGAEREYSDPSSGPLIGRQHQPVAAEVPEQQEEIEQRIRTRVGEDPRTSDVPRLNVEVNEGAADIRGEVHSEEEKQVVEEIARDTEGVTEVRNLLTVNPNAPSRHKAAGGEPDT